MRIRNLIKIIKGLSTNILYFLGIIIFNFYAENLRKSPTRTRPCLSFDSLPTPSYRRRCVYVSTLSIINHLIFSSTTTPHGEHPLLPPPTSYSFRVPSGCLENMEICTFLPDTPPILCTTNKSSPHPAHSHDDDDNNNDNNAISEILMARNALFCDRPLAIFFRIRRVAAHEYWKIISVRGRVVRAFVFFFIIVILFRGDGKYFIELYIFCIFGMNVILFKSSGIVISMFIVSL